MIFFLIFEFVMCDFYDLNGVIGDGQSVSVGVNSGNLRLTTQEFGNLKLSLGNLEGTWPISPESTQLSLVPLVEPIRKIVNEEVQFLYFLIKIFFFSYPTNIFGETPHTSMANQLSSMNEGFVSVHTVVGESGMTIEKLKKGAVDDGSSGNEFKYYLMYILF
jgi:hypothetical protein